MFHFLVFFITFVAAEKVYVNFYYPGQDVRLDYQKVFRALGPRTECFERLFL